LSKSREAVINYFKSFKGEEKPFNEVKVLLVGDGGAGKLSGCHGLEGCRGWFEGDIPHTSAG
jgi:GTPase SAR1 family protein